MGKLSREEYRKREELKEARQRGEIAPETNARGESINPHLPQFILDKPWYIKDGDDGPSLDHQRAPGAEAPRGDGISSASSQATRPGLIDHSWCAARPIWGRPAGLTLRDAAPRGSLSYWLENRVRTRLRGRCARTPASPEPAPPPV